jgi:23S rRNA pseudouridine1911/1915/1917 synthase
MHCVPLRPGDCGTLLDWYAAIFPPVRTVPVDRSGRKACEGGILHRLDYETRGLVLAAKNRRAFEFLKAQQDEGRISKEYRARCAPRAPVPSGFPPPPPPDFPPSGPLVIASYFRPYGPGRKAVRPVLAPGPARRHIATDRGAPYRTELLTVRAARDAASRGEWDCTIRLVRGFRHQIRCHLAWIGFPVVNDPLYAPGGADGGSGGAEAPLLGLAAQAISFPDPRTGERCEYRDSSGEDSAPGGAR